MNFVVLITFYYRARRLQTASNRLLINLLAADFILLANCYIAVYQAFVGVPVLGTYGKMIRYNLDWSVKPIPIASFVPEYEIS